MGFNILKSKINIRQLLKILKKSVKLHETLVYVMLVFDWFISNDKVLRKPFYKSTPGVDFNVYVYTQQRSTHAKSVT